MAARILARSFSSSSRALAKAVQPPIQTYSLAGKYSGAAYSAALTKSEATLKAVESDLTSVSAILEKDPAVSDRISDPTLSPADKKKAAQSLLSKAKDGGNEITKNLFDVLAENGRLHDLSRVIEEFETIMAAHRGEVTITVTSAAPLDSSTSSRLEKALKDSAVAKTGKSTKIVNIVNPSILGGLVIDFGDKSIDLSVQSKVQKMNSLLTQAV